MVVEDRPADMCMDVRVHEEQNLPHVPQTTTSYDSAPEADRQEGDLACVALTRKSSCVPQRMRSQTPSRMSTLKALLTFAALHGACLGSGPLRGNLDRASSSCGQDSAEVQVKGQEGRNCPAFGAREGRGSRLERSGLQDHHVSETTLRPPATKALRAEATSMGRGPRARSACCA